MLCGQQQAFRTHKDEQRIDVVRVVRDHVFVVTENRLLYEIPALESILVDTGERQTAVGRITNLANVSSTPLPAAQNRHL